MPKYVLQIEQFDTMNRHVDHAVPPVTDPNRERNTNRIMQYLNRRLTRRDEAYLPIDNSPFVSLEGNNYVLNYKGPLQEMIDAGEVELVGERPNGYGLYVLTAPRKPNLFMYAFFSAPKTEGALNAVRMRRLNLPLGHDLEKTIGSYLTGETGTLAVQQSKAQTKIGLPGVKAGQRKSRRKNRKSKKTRKH